jgi:glycosyltransferase involved in cell wall biosynthesis
MEQRGTLTAPLVTIGITCFNAADTITRAIASALAQDWPNLEVIVVDDLSSDGSAAVLEAATRSDRRVRLVRHEQNTGAAGARNTILANARGEFVAFFDDDDESLPGRISGQINTLTGYERRTGAALVACYAAGSRRYPNGYIKPLPAIGVGGKAVPHGPSMADWLLFFRRRSDWEYGSGIPACALMARRSTFAALNGFDASLRRAEDADFAIRLALASGHFIGTKEPLFVQWATSGEDKAPERNLEAEQALADKHADYLRSVKRYRYARSWPRLRYLHLKGHYGRFLAELALLFICHPLSVTSQLAVTGPKRLLHERRMRSRAKA